MLSRLLATSASSARAGARLGSRYTSMRDFANTRPVQGVEITPISPGDGVNFPKKGDRVSIHYVGTFLDGKEFDSSRRRGSPLVTKIGVGSVIKGWDEGVPQLSLGQKAILTVSPDYAYGAGGYPPIIPPNSTLKFEVELIKIN
ncbi:FK506 binding protein proline rotamase rapamycin-binding protein [Psilocybe cubensis]|uniref:FK506 binding protein proline rotamase rapamycin-binding protein n=2 Tax=Psilocybe cubensis TaxID=181762 RepID=A0ACB8GSS3_PSICU|nr:FK506 binding protein proline rotamase rapamycin-binding protein [Psilocybe cubensis]KAH9478629.1 FK506 binding protein proline rotamase rapamycin-binding protein [Psilocybe cubensis]